MASPLRALVRRVLGVVRTPTYYLPWLTRPGITCTLILHNVEARFQPGSNVGPFAVTANQHDADGTMVRRYQTQLPDSTSAVELALDATEDGCGFVTVAGEGMHADFFVTLSDGHDYTATHGRGEFVEHYPARARAVLRVLGSLLALVGRTIPAFARDQYLYASAESRSHLLLMNLSNVPNRIRVRVSGDGTLGATLLTLPPMGSRLLDTTRLTATSGRGTVVRRARLEGNAWFNLYLVGAGPRDLAGPLSLMHVK